MLEIIEKLTEAIYFFGNNAEAKKLVGELNKLTEKDITVETVIAAVNDCNPSPMFGDMDLSDEIHYRSSAVKELYSIG